MKLPQWTTLFTGHDVGGEDHLGVEGVAQAYQQYLVPGIITTTDHARYYSFYCWVLYRFIFLPDSSLRIEDFRGRFYKRHEVAFILGCYSHHKDQGVLTGLVGGGNMNSNARHIWESGNPVSLDASYFKDPLGGFGQYYRTAMQTMGLVDESESPRWVYRLTERGKALAEAYERSIQTTNYFRLLREGGTIDQLEHNDAIEYGKSACLCADGLGAGEDRELLRTAFFRLGESDLNESHVRRRLTLALTLDMTQQSEDLPLRSNMRKALYVGEYAPNRPYVPATALDEWYRRWRYVQVRHSYTTALQGLWATFLNHLRTSPEEGVSFQSYMSQAESYLPRDWSNSTANAYLDELCASVGLVADWKEAASTFDSVCNLSTGFDEITLFEQMVDSRRDPAVLIPNGLRILCQIYMRFHDLHRTDDPIWREIAGSERLPLTRFFADLSYHLQQADWSLGDMLAWLYRDYILGQHEFVALQKLRYQRYNTLKCYYREGLFVWAYNPAEYAEPIRYPALRLSNGLTILVDLGLVRELDGGICQLTPDGMSYLSQVTEASSER